MPRIRPFAILASALVVTLCLVGRGEAVLLLGKPGRNLTAPTGPWAGSGWELQGEWQGCGGTPVAPHWFLTARHVGGRIGDTFRLDGKAYVTDGQTFVPRSDLALWHVRETFPRWAEIWDDAQGGEIGKVAVIFGRGTERGAAIVSPEGRPQGWRWGNADGRLSWGTNRLDSLFDLGPEYGEALIASFDAGGDATEATLSNGDSGGGVFLRGRDGRWRLAGANYDINPGYGGRDNFYRLTGDSERFLAAVYDERGLWKGLENDPYRQISPSAPKPVPMRLSVSRIAPHADFIRKTIAGPPPRRLPARRAALAGAGVAILVTLAAAVAVRRRFSG